MTPPSEPPRRYSDEEVKALLERAAELESQGASLPALREGTTLSELEAIAAEAGIDSALVRRAAQELDSPLGRSLVEPEGSAAAFLGAPTANELEHTFPFEAPVEVLEELVPIIRRAADGVGQPSLLGRTLTWQSTDSGKSRELQVAVSIGRGETRLAIEERYGNLAGGLFGGMIGGGGVGIGLGIGLGVGIGALGSALFATAFPIAAIGGFYAASRMIYRRVVEARRRKLTRLLEELVAVVDAANERPESETD